MAWIPTLVTIFALVAASAAALGGIPFLESPHQDDNSGGLVRLASIILVLYGFFTVWLYPRFFSPLRGLPQPKGALPILGHAFAPYTQPRGHEFFEWTRTVPNDGIIRFSGLFNSDHLLLTSPAAFKEVLVTKAYEFEKPESWRSIMRYFSGDGLLVVEGDSHRFLRKKLGPGFSFPRIKLLQAVFWKKAGQLTDGVAKEIAEGGGNSVVEMAHWANQVTMDIIGLAALGTDLRTLERSGEEVPLVQTYEKLLEPTISTQIYMAVALMTSPDLIRKLPLRVNTELKDTQTKLFDICLGLVQDKKIELAENESEKTEQTSTKPAYNEDILAHILKDGDLTDRQIVYQMLTFLSAGHETTSSAFTWAIYVLARDPNLQSRLRAEIHANMPAPSEDIDISDLSSTLEALPLLHGVCNEVLRIYPTVPTTVRVPVKDNTLLNYHIPKGTEVYLCPWAANRNQDIWGPQADDFLPERWINTDEETGQQRPNNNGGVSNNYAGLTFLHGPRSCIGQEFAKAELRTLLALFVGRFEMELRDPLEAVVPAGLFTTKPKNGMPVRLKNVGNWGRTA